MRKINIKGIRYDKDVNKKIEHIHLEISTIFDLSFRLITDELIQNGQCEVRILLA